MLQIKNISKQYKTGDLIQIALNNVSLNFRDNEFVSILGPSGSGKTTLLNIIGGLDNYDKGDLIINNISTKKYKDRDWDSYRNHTIGFVFQSYNLIPHQTILANVELALTISGVSKKERRKRAIQALDKVGLKNQIHKKPNQMSGGQMQRVAIARALVNNPDILLADEPTGALDSTTSVQVMELLKEVANDRLVIMVTHNPELAQKYSTRIVNLKDGEIQGDTNPFNPEDTYKEKPKHKNLGKSSMSLLTAFSLSLNNLLTKKGRSILTSFAGSIGIIGIALILALSSGFQNYVDKIQEDTLTSYPLTVQSETTDMASLLLSSNGKSEENLDKFINYIDVDIHSLEEKFKNLNIHLGVNINEINLAKEEIKNEYVNNSYNEDFIVNKEYIDEIINCIKDENMYSLRQKSRYGSLNIEGKLKYLEDIEDFNEDEKGGMYSPILVIYRPAKYLRGSYILEDTYYVYIKRQPLNALINQEKLNEKGIDGMGSIIYKKLKHDLTNENLQEILAEIYIYANKNNLNFENIKLTDISSNRLWLTSERLKKEFKELRYYHKNLTQKIKDIYDSTGAYYTQLGGKYIFNTREFAHCYKTYKAKDING